MASSVDVPIDVHVPIEVSIKVAVHVPMNVAVDIAIWPVNKRHEFARRRFNVLALVVGTPPLFELAGVVSKRRFERERLTASDEFGRLDLGTWYMDRSVLAGPEVLMSAS
jgi:hypothetical protein